MSNDEQEVRAALARLYEAVEAMVTGKGLEPMKAAWHHNARVTTVHPIGDWATGWDEVIATWEGVAGFGRADRGGSKITGVGVQIYGDIAYTMCTFHAAPAWGGEKMACTDIFQKIDGVWKAIHHHADKSPAMGAALEKMLKEG